MNDMYYVCILHSRRTGKHYIGYTLNIEKRLQEHNAGRTESLIRHIPLEIMRVERYSLYIDARRRERQLKQYKSGGAFKKLLDQ